MRSLKTGFAVAALMLGTSALTSPAFATGNGGNNCTLSSDCNNTYNDNGTYNQGGTGVGIGLGIGVGKGGNSEANNNGNGNGNFNGNLKDVGNNENNLNHNLNGNLSHNNLSNRNYNSNKQSQGQGQDQAQRQGQGQGQAQSVDDSGNSSVSINNERPPVSTAYAAPLAAGEDTCMGSSSIGGQGVGFGLSIGTTWTDDNCRHLKNSRQLVALGYHRAATALMCVDEDVKNAMAAAGTPCPGTEQAAAAAVAAPAIYAQQQMPPARTYTAPASKYVPMAPIPDEPVRRHH